MYYLTLTDELFWVLTDTEYATSAGNNVEEAINAFRGKTTALNNDYIIKDTTITNTYGKHDSTIIATSETLDWTTESIKQQYPELLI